MRPLSHPIWESRLQVLWILLSAAYAIFGKSDPRRAVSSILVVIAGFLLIALFAHVMFAREAHEAKAALLVAFASSVFLATTSYVDFKDPLASGFAISFSLMCGSLLCLELSGRASQQLRYRYFTAIIFTLMAGAVGYPLTLLQKLILNRTIGLDGVYVAGAQGVASLACFGIGMVVGPRILPRTLPHNDRKSRRALFAILPFAALLPVALFIGLYRDRLLAFAGSNAVALRFLILQAIGLVVVPVLAFSMVELDDRFPRSRRLLFLLATSVVSAVVVTTLSELGRPFASSHRWFMRVAIVELPTFSLVYVSLMLGTTVACALLRSAVSRVNH
jgi:hypothetical protein